jgi:phenylacetate-coenzyme A ligase PaaK-like adenylate-forming protein
VTAGDQSGARCASALDKALASAPFYKQWRNRDPGPTHSPADRLAALPVLTKRDLRAHVPRGFMYHDEACADGFATGEVELVTTSGTAGERLCVVWHQPWWDRSEREAAGLHPVLARIFGGPHKEVVLTSPVCAGNVCHMGEASMADRTIGSILFLNQCQDPTTWSDACIRRMADELANYQPEIIEADPAYLSLFAAGSLRSGLSLWQPACIVLTYEFPSRVHLRWIRLAFPGVPVVSSYGSTETGHVFTQCAEGTFHQNTATCHVEVQRFREGRGAPDVGRLLVTTLDSPWFALVRFDVGDLVRLDGDAACPCGRADGMTVRAIEGRLCDLTFDTRGAAVTVKQVDDAVGVVECLTGYQVEQVEPLRYALRFTADGHGEAEATERLKEKLLGVYGAGARIDVQRVAALPPEQSGKFRLARTALPVGPGELFS